MFPHWTAAYTFHGVSVGCSSDHGSHPVMTETHYLCVSVSQLLFRFVAGALEHGFTTGTMAVNPYINRCQQCPDNREHLGNAAWGSFHPARQVYVQLSMLAAITSKAVRCHCTITGGVRSVGSCYLCAPGHCVTSVLDFCLLMSVQLSQLRHSSLSLYAPYE